MTKDERYIKELFAEDGIQSPEKLSSDNISELLPDREGEACRSCVPETAVAPSKAGRRFRYLAAAACIILAAAVIPVYNALTSPPDVSAAEDGSLYQFRSVTELKKLVNSLSYENTVGVRSGNAVPLTADEDTAEAAAGTSKASSAAADSASQAGSAHSETYLQVEAVDESDIVKTDGKYIYYVTDRQEVIILSASEGRTEKLSVIGSEGSENYVSDIYVKDDRLITVGWIYDDEDDTASTGAVIYDISDRSRPAVIGEFRQSGHPVSDRMVGKYLYLVTNQYTNGSALLPKCTKGDGYSELPVRDICCVPKPESPSYTILTAIDTESGSKMTSRTRAILGTAQNIYCTDHSLYTAVTDWNDDSGSPKTDVIRASLDGLKISFDRTVRIDGYVNDQFSMDEKDGNLRIATTGLRNGMEVNNLFILDSSLHKKGKISGFARNESIKAVRFIGDIAYIITYEQIDPLFVIDISDPEAPRICGEVKIDGFSSLLLPVSKNRLLGIGYATGDNGYGGEYEDGLKLALFDISDPSAPAVLDSREFRGMHSEAQYTHLALSMISGEDRFAIPYQIYDYEEDSRPENGVLIFSADDSIEIKDRHSLKSAEYLLRCVYIDDYMYALDSEGNVRSFSI